jgi:hypothetical protein
VLISTEAVLGLPGYQITGIEERAGKITIRATKSCVGGPFHEDLSCPGFHRLLGEGYDLVSRSTGVGRSLPSTEV